MSPQTLNSGNNPLSNTTENYYMHKMNKILPSSNSIEIPKNENMANSMIQFRKSGDNQMKNFQRGRKKIGSERFDIKGVSPQKMNYHAQNPISPFQKNGGNDRLSRQGLTSTSTSTSLNKFSFKRNSKINLDNNSEISKSGVIKSINGMNSLSMKELGDLDVSPEKRY